MSEKKSGFLALATKEIKLNLSKQDKRRLLVLLAVLAAVVGVSIARYQIYINLRGDLTTRILNAVYYVLIMGIAIAGMKLSGMDIKPSFRFKGAKQYIWGVASGFLVLFVITVVPSFFGISIIGGHHTFPIETYIYQFFHYFVFVGPVEEFLFRVYVQETLTEVLPRFKWISVIVAAGLFGLWHIISGSWNQVRFAASLGLFWGLCKYFSKNCTFISTSISHAMYDFGLLFAMQFIVK